MKRALTVVFSVIIIASLFAAGYAYFSEPKAPAAETITDLRVVSSPKQVKAERPPVFPDPYENWIKLPEGANLAKGKPVRSGAVTEIYAAANVTDGELTSYWESKGLPAELVIDLEATHNIATIAVRLNPAPIWEPRTQSFEVLVSEDGENYSSVVPNTRYEFNSETGNMVRVDFEPTPAHYVKLVFTEKSSGRSNGGQAAEVQVYE